MRGLVRGWLVLVIAGMGVLGTMAGRAAWTGGAATAQARAPAGATGGGESRPAIAAGSTGTAALPPGRSPPPVAITAARPFAFGAAPAADRARALQCLTAAVYYEAGSQSEAGQRAVAQVVLNRVRHPAFPASVCGVVYQGAARGACQFSFACDGATTRAPPAAGWARAATIAARALTGSVFAPVGLATHYHSFTVTPPWNHTLVMTDLIGAHLFHRWKGGWGTAAAFVQRYAAHEPIVGPAPVGIAGPAIATDEVPRLVAAAVPVPLRAPTVPLPRSIEMADEVLATPPGRLPPAPQVLDRWKDAGRPL